MSEHKIPRDQPLPSRPEAESFVINDPEVGKSFAVRECTDEQLARYMVNCTTQQKALGMQVLQAMGQATQAAAMASVIGYELDRRRRSITLATPGDIAGLRRQ